MVESVQLEGDGPPGGGSSVSLGNDPDASEKPDGVPDKFWNKESGEIDTVSLLSSYVELERKVGKPEETTQESSASEEVSKEGSEDSFNLTKYEDEFRTNNNTLKEETYTELQSKFGLGKGEVDKYIQYRQGEVEEFTQEIFGMAGGEESYNSLMGWASNHLSASEITDINTTLESSDRDAVRVAVLKLNNKYREAVAAAPKSLAGTTSSQQSCPKPFVSIQEAVEARKDKRFELDPAYRAEWEQRVGSSPFVNKG